MFEPYCIDEQLKITEFFSMFECYRDEDYSFQGETHDFWECLYVIDGNVCVSGDERIYHMCRHDIIFHKPLELHKYYNEAKNGSNLLIFSFNASGKIMKYFENKVFHFSSVQENIMNDLIDFVRARAGKDKQNTEFFLKYLIPDKNSTIYLQYLSCVITQLFLSIFEECTETHAANSPDVVIFKKAVKYMNKNLDKQLLIEVLAKECSISPTGLKRIFAKYAGLGIHKYFLKLKIAKAARLLKSGHSVTEISELLGFSSQGYFSHAFKRETGKSPSEYIKAIKPIK